MYKQNIKQILIFLLFFLFPCYCTCVTIPNVNLKTISPIEHLKNKIIIDICAKRDAICTSGSMKLCTVRMLKGRLQFREFQNDCYFFLTNTCEFPGNEWAIKDVGSCDNVNLRRYAESIQNVTRRDTTPSNATQADATPLNVTQGNVTDDSYMRKDSNETELAGSSEMENGTEIESPTPSKPQLRTAATRSTYGVEAAPDDHPCPYHCPNVYEPVCTNINRGYGKYYKLLFFVNHCEADRHYCIHWATEYTPPPYEEYELVNRPSNAAWSYCAANKYMNFVTFAESASSLGHYGWLAGPQPPSHILEPYERIPGFG